MLENKIGVNFASRTARAMLKKRTSLERANCQRPVKMLEGGDRRMEVRASWGAVERRWWMQEWDTSNDGG